MTTGYRQGPLYPYEFAIGNMILLLLAVGAIFDGDTMSILSRLTGSASLVIVGGLLAWRTQLAGYVPWNVTTTRLLETQKNLPGWATVILVALDVVAVPLLWFR